MTSDMAGLGVALVVALVGWTSSLITVIGLLAWFSRTRRVPASAGYEAQARLAPRHR